MVWRFLKSFKCLKNKLKTASFDTKFELFININGVKYSKGQDNEATKDFDVPVVTAIVTLIDNNQKKVIDVSTKLNWLRKFR